MATVEKNVFLSTLKTSFTYSLSNDLDELKNVISSKTGILIENIEKLEWRENKGLAKEVKNLMKMHNLSYCSTSWIEDDIQYFVINHQIDNNYYIYSGKAMNGWIMNELIEPDYIELTNEILEKIPMIEIIYAEYAEPGAMGNAGGIIIYIIINKKLVCYETTCKKDSLTYDNTIYKLLNNSNYLRNNEKINEEWIYKYYSGGFGNYVFINKNKKIKSIGEYFLFIHDKYYYCIRSSVQGVFVRVVYQMEKELKLFQMQ